MNEEVGLEVEGKCLWEVSCDSFYLWILCNDKGNNREFSIGSDQSEAEGLRIIITRHSSLNCKHQSNGQAYSLAVPARVKDFAFVFMTGPRQCLTFLRAILYNFASSTDHQLTTLLLLLALKAYSPLWLGLCSRVFMIQTSTWASFRVELQDGAFTTLEDVNHFQ